MTPGRWKATPRGGTLLSASWLGVGVPFWGLPQRRGTPTPSLPFGLPEGIQGWTSRSFQGCEGVGSTELGAVKAATLFVLALQGPPAPCCGRDLGCQLLGHLTPPACPCCHILPSLEGQSCWAAIYSGLRLFTERASERESSWQGTR